MVSSHAASRAHYWTCPAASLPTQGGLGGLPCSGDPQAAVRTPDITSAAGAVPVGGPSHLLPFPKGRLQAPLGRQQVAAGGLSPHPALSQQLPGPVDVVLAPPSSGQGRRDALRSHPSPLVCGDKGSAVKGAPAPQLSRDLTSHPVTLSCHTREEKGVMFILSAPAPPTPAEPSAWKPGPVAWPGRPVLQSCTECEKLIRSIQLES